MNIQQALENIRFFSNKFPEEEFLCIREHRDEAIPVLLEYAGAIVVNDKDSLPENYNGHFFSMFLLAEFKVREAFPCLIQYLEFDSSLVDYWLGDSLTESFGSILASVATPDDIPRMKTVVENEKLDTFQRLAALSALQVLYTEDAYSRNDYFAYLHHILKTCHEDPMFLAGAIIDCEKAGMHEALPAIEALYKDGLVDELWTTLSGVRRGLFGIDEEAAKQALKKDRSCLFVQDAVNYLSNWACFNEKPMPEKASVRINPFGYKVGRNEPCPCGSGKKYKKCCGF